MRHHRDIDRANRKATIMVLAKNGCRIRICSKYQNVVAFNNPYEILLLSQFSETIRRLNLTVELCTHGDQKLGVVPSRWNGLALFLRIPLTTVSL